MSRSYFLIIPFILLSNSVSASTFLTEVSEIKLPMHYEKKEVAKSPPKKKNSKIETKQNVKVVSHHHISKQNEINTLKKQLEEMSRQNALLTARVGISQDQSVNEELKKLTIELDKKDRVLKALQLQVEDLTHKNAKLSSESRRTDPSSAVSQEQSNKS